MKFLPKCERGASRFGGVLRAVVRKAEKNADAFAIGRLQVAAILQKTLSGAVDEFARQLRTDRGRQVLDQLRFICDLAINEAGFARARLE